MHAFYSAKDIPGKNSFVPFRHVNAFLPYSEDEEVFVGENSTILYNGQPCGIILANSMALANYGASQVKITYKKIKGKKPLVTGDLLSALDTLKDPSDSQFSAMESSGISSA